MYILAMKCAIESEVEHNCQGTTYCLGVKEDGELRSQMGQRVR
jgi:hypothetical protein